MEKALISPNGIYKATLLTVSSSTAQLIKIPTNVHSRKVLAIQEYKTLKNPSYFICDFAVRREYYAALSLASLIEGAEGPGSDQLPHVLL